MVENIKSKGYAARDESGKLSPWDFERRPLRDDDVLIEIKFVGICHQIFLIIKPDYGCHGFAFSHSWLYRLPAHFKKDESLPTKQSWLMAPLFCLIVNNASFCSLHQLLVRLLQWSSTLLQLSIFCSQAQHTLFKCPQSPQSTIVCIGNPFRTLRINC